MLYWWILKNIKGRSCTYSRRNTSENSRKEPFPTHVKNLELIISEILWRTAILVCLGPLACDHLPPKVTPTKKPVSIQSHRKGCTVPEGHALQCHLQIWIWSRMGKGKFPREHGWGLPKQGTFSPAREGPSLFLLSRIWKVSWTRLYMLPVLPFLNRGFSWTYPTLTLLYAWDT